MFSKEDIQSVILLRKNMTNVEVTKLVMDIFDKQPTVSNFINEGHYKIINRTERLELNYYVQLIYLLYIKSNDTIKDFTKEQLNTKHSTVEEQTTLVDYLHVLILDNQYIRTKSVSIIFTTCCTYIYLMQSI